MPEYMKLNGTQLKLFAALIMVIDHIGAVIFPRIALLRIVGRISFPIFCFMAAEGFAHTKNLKKYMLRLLVAGVVSQPFYSLCFAGNLTYGTLNIMFTFLLSGAAVCVHKKLPQGRKEFAVVAAVLMAVLAMYLHTDYGEYGVILVFLFYLLRENQIALLLITGCFQILAAVGIQRYSAFSLVPIAFYNGKRGRNLKYFFYIFYPLHLSVIYGAAVHLGIYGLPWS